MQGWDLIKNTLTLSYRFEEGGYDVVIQLGSIADVGLYENPAFGGEPRHLGDYSCIKSAIEAGRKLT